MFEVVYSLRVCFEEFFHSVFDEFSDFFDNEVFVFDVFEACGKPFEVYHADVVFSDFAFVCWFDFDVVVDDFLE